MAKSLSSLSSGEECDIKKSKKRRKKGKKTSKKPEDKSKGEHKPDEEAQKQRAVVRQESGGLENEIHDMMNKNIAPHFSQIERGLHNRIDELNNRLQKQFCHMYELQSQMHDQVSYLIAQQNQHEPFSCNASFGGSFAIHVEGKQDEHDNSRNGSTVGNATKEILKRSSGPVVLSTNLVVLFTDHLLFYYSSPKTSEDPHEFIMKLQQLLLDELENSKENSGITLQGEKYDNDLYVSMKAFWRQQRRFELARQRRK